jgi:hypothetical protein
MKNHLDMSDSTWLAKIAMSKSDCNNQAAEYFREITGTHIGHAHIGHNPRGEYAKWFSDNKDKTKLQLLLEAASRHDPLNEIDRLWVVQGLLEEGSSQAVEKVYELRNDRSPRVAFRASLLLAQKGDLKGIDGLVYLTERKESGPWDLRQFKMLASVALRAFVGHEPPNSMTWFQWLCKFHKRLYWVPELRIYLLSLEGKK